MMKKYCIGCGEEAPCKTEGCRAAHTWCRECGTSMILDENGEACCPNIMCSACDDTAGVFATRDHPFYCEDCGRQMIDLHCGACGGACPDVEAYTKDGRRWLGVKCPSIAEADRHVERRVRLKLEQMMATYDYRWKDPAPEVKEWTMGRALEAASNAVLTVGGVYTESLNIEYLPGREEYRMYIMVGAGHYHYARTVEIKLSQAADYARSTAGALRCAFSALSTDTGTLGCSSAVVEAITEFLLWREEVDCDAILSQRDLALGYLGAKSLSNSVVRRVVDKLAEYFEWWS